MSTMGSRADSTRHLATLWRGEKSWEWTVLNYGHAQPIGYRNFWRNRHFWRFHFTPVCAARNWSKWSVGVCFGKRMIFLEAHR